MAQTIKMPKLGFDMAEGTLVRWVKDEGAAIQKGDVVAEIETDKATLEVDSAFSGVMARQLVEAGSVVPVGTPIAIIAEAGEKIEAPAQPEAKPSEPVKEEPNAEPKAEPAQAMQAAPAPVIEMTSPPVESGRISASPLAKRMAEEKGVPLAAIKGSGPGGRIVKRDLENAQAPAVQQAGAQGKAVLPAYSPAAAVVVPGEDVVVPLSRLRGAIGRRMVESKQAVPHFYVTRSFDVTQMLEMRKEINAALPEGEKISVNDFIVKAAALALRQFPNINASLGTGSIIQHAHVNVGVAVSVEGGLLTVVVRDADVKPLRQLSREGAEMVSRARSGKVKPEDIEGSTFSISNLGMYEVDEFIAIINPPEVAILAVGAAKLQPVVKEGRVETGMLMSVTLSADHRVTDGVEAAQFMQALGALIENPWRLVL